MDLDRRASQTGYSFHFFTLLCLNLCFNVWGVDELSASLSNPSFVFGNIPGLLNEG